MKKEIAVAVMATILSLQLMGNARNSIKAVYDSITEAKVQTQLYSDIPSAIRGN